MNRIILALLVVCMLFAFAGCTTEPQKQNPNESYNVDYGSDANSYCIFVNKQLTTVLNHVSTHMITALRVTDTTADSMATGLEYSISDVEKAMHEVEVMHPAAGYESKRENTLRLMQQALDDMKTLLQILKAEPLNSAELAPISEKLQNDFVALTAEFNLYYT